MLIRFLNITSLESHIHIVKEQILSEYQTKASTVICYQTMLNAIFIWNNII